MKQVVRCGNHGGVIRKHGSYTAQLQEEVMVYDDEAEKKVKKLKKTTIKLCRPCYIEAGYKPRGSGKPVHTDEDVKKAYFIGCQDGKIQPDFEKKIGIKGKKNVKK